MPDQSNFSARQLQAKDLSLLCPTDIFKDLNQDSPRTEIIGQERAVRSMQFGLDMDSPGYNIFMTGETGTGKSTYARTTVSRKAQECPTPNDWCYLYNFEDPENPRAVSLPAGKGQVLRDDMKELIEDARTAITNEFEGGDFEKHRAEIGERFQRDIGNIFQDLEEKVRSRGFALQRGEAGFTPVPLKDDGEPMSAEEYQQLDDETRKELEEKGAEIQQLIRSAMRKVRQIEKEAKSAVRDLEKRMGSFAIRPLIDQLQEEYADYPEVSRYLENVHDDIVDNLDAFKSSEDEDSGQQLAMMMLGGARKDEMNRYKVNLLVNNAETEGAPMVEETNPTYYNLFGKIEFTSSMGHLTTNHLEITAGALHRANGGYLILRAEDVLTNALSWDTLKRTLKSGCIRIENIGEQYRMVPTATIKPEPVPVDVKIIMIGSPLIYYLLYSYDPDFSKHFKIRADFDLSMDRDEDNLLEYGRFVRTIQQRDELLPFHPDAVCEVVNYSSRLTSDQTKLSARFNKVVEVVYEAHTWAEKDGHEEVRAEHVTQALEEKMFRSNLIESHIREAIRRGKILVDVEDEAEGQVNALSVISLGHYSFGHPSRITANTYMGNSGVVNIERQVKISGTSHSKGVLILSGYLSEKFAQDKPLALSASLTFEQMYGGVDGDSASSTELYALLSSLSGLPIKQSIAVTGSVNQKGKIQPIGGVNEKIEGFYYTCKAKGLTGEQGVMIPEQNVDNLMLNEEVREAVEDGDFHVWAVSDVRGGIELLTGVPAGEPNEEGHYPEDTVFGMADTRLRNMAEIQRRFGDSSDDSEEE
ncbi:MAG: ATP-binding protein [Bacillota bacterium]